jgi:hypothetical protein
MVAMRHARFFLAVILCMLFFAPLSARAAPTITFKVATTTTNATSNPLSNATVNLYCRFRDGRKLISATGSGVFIGDRGVILTNAHVAQFFLLAENEKRIKGGCTVRTGSPARSTYHASVLYLPPQWLKDNVAKISEEDPHGSSVDDFALLYVTDAINGVLPAHFPALQLSLNLFAVPTHTTVTVTGYPAGQLNFDAIRTELAAMTASSTIMSLKSLGPALLPDLITLTSSKVAAQGISGGPIANSKEELLGIVSTKSDAKKDPVLRGISMLYITRALYQDTHQTLFSFLTGDFGTLASTSRAELGDALISQLEEGLRELH